MITPHEILRYAEKLTGETAGLDIIRDAAPYHGAKGNESYDTSKALAAGL